MINSLNKFDLYRYQLLPQNRYLQTNLLTNVQSIDELIERKNEFFDLALENANDFSDSTHQTVTKILYSEDNFHLYRIANNKSVRIETQDFTDKIVDNWPSILVAIWNQPDKQLIAVQKRTKAFSSPRVIVGMIFNKLRYELSNYHLSALYEPLFEKTIFWDLLKKYQGSIKSVEFDFVTPNMANISKVLSKDLRNFSKSLNGVRSNLGIYADDSATLRLSKNDETLAGLVDYSSQGGGNITVKVGKLRQKIQTAKTVKEITISDMEATGSVDKVVTAIKDLMR